MLIRLPISETEFSVKVFVSLPEGYEDYTMNLSIAAGTCNAVIPGGILEDEVEVTAQFTNHQSLAVGEVMMLKERVEVLEPEPELKVEVEPEPEAEVKDEGDPDEVGPFFAPKADLVEDQEEDIGEVDDPWSNE